MERCDDTERYRTNLRILMIGFAVPDTYIDEIQTIDRYLPVQTHKLSWAIIRGLEANQGVVIDLISALPISTFPNCRKILVGFRRWDRGNGSLNVVIPFINILGLKHLTRFLSCLLFATLWALRTSTSTERIILLYGIQSAHMYAALIVARIFGIKLLDIVSDPPGVMLLGETSFTKSIRRIDRQLLIRAMQSMNGLIVLVGAIADDFAPGVPFMVMEGAVSLRDVTKSYDASTGIDTDQDSGKFIVMYAGGLSESYGTDILLEALNILDDDDIVLWLFGSGEMSETVENTAKKDKRIVFGGSVSNDEILERYQRASVLINPRPSSQYITLYSFPSKTLEYMISGKPTITTRLPGIPSEYFEYVVSLVEETPAGIASILRLLKAKPVHELNQIGVNARSYVIQNKTEIHQGKRIFSFLESILDNTAR